MASLHALVPRGPYYSEFQLGGLESLQLGPACRKLCHTLESPPQIDRTTHADQLAGLWTNIQPQSQIRLVSSAADWCSPCSDDEISQFKISQIHGMIPKANWVLVTRHYTSCCKMSCDLYHFSRKHAGHPASSYHRRSGPLLSTAEVVSCGCTVATRLHDSVVSSPASFSFVGFIAFVVENMTSL